ncbi:MAG: hypothetical protein JO356_17515 [Acidobacteria bacterium]|nr:hypothetical protein [Acidobacteriota bacterium]
MNQPELDRESTGRLYVTLSGLPLFIELGWPFHQSGSGADFSVLHGDVRLAGSDGLHAPVAVNLSATVREVLPSLAAKDVEGPVINSLRKEVDRRQLEFVKSGKRVPVQFSSRYYDFKRKRWVFGRATNEQISTLLARKVFWESWLRGNQTSIADPIDALYVESTPSEIEQIGQGLAASGLVSLSGEWAQASPRLLAQADQFEAERREAQAQLELKHAFEDGRRRA